MKKIVFLLIVLLFPTLVFAKEDVYIKNVEVVEDFMKDVEAPSYEGLNLRFNLALKHGRIGSKAYRVTLRNDSNKTYEISNAKSFKKGKYLEYVFQYEDENETNLIKPNEEKNIIIGVFLNGIVDDEDFVDGVYSEQNEMQLNLSNGDNPKTSRNLGIIFLILGIVIVSIGLTTKKKQSAYLLLLLLLVPVSIYAYEKITLTIDTKIEIRQRGTVLLHLIKNCVGVEDFSQKLEFDRGMTWKELEEEFREWLDENETLPQQNGIPIMNINSQLVLDFLDVLKNPDNQTKGREQIVFSDQQEEENCLSQIIYPTCNDNSFECSAAKNKAEEEAKQCMLNTTKEVTINDVIRPKEEGEYFNSIVCELN